MLHGVYKQDGPDERLQQKGALLQPDLENEDRYIVQFDPIYLSEAFGWHSLPKM